MHGTKKRAPPPWHDHHKGYKYKELSDSIIYISTKFNLERIVVVFKCDGGANMKKCSYSICSHLDCTAVITPKKHLFAIDSFAHVIAGSCKAVIVDVKSEDVLLDK